MDPPPNSTQSTSVFDQHLLEYTCHYVTAENKVSQTAGKYLCAGMQFFFFDFKECQYHTFSQVFLTNKYKFIFALEIE
jgi:hypothetical protein